MEYDMLVLTVVIVGFTAIYRLLRQANEWVYVRSLGEMQFSLPPGDMGWPFLGNMLTFIRSFKNGDPDSFISMFDTRFGHTRIYRAFMFGSPSIIVSAPDACKQVLMDDKKFGPGWPKSITKLMGKKGFHGISDEEHKRLLRLTSASIKGREVMSIYIEYIEEIVKTSIHKWAKEENPIEFLSELRKVAFRVIIHVVLGCENDSLLEIMEKKYSVLSRGLKAMAINLPGFAFHKALKARKQLVNILQGLVDERRKTLQHSNGSKTNTYMVDILMETKDEDGGKLSDEEIVDITIIYLLAGHESFGHASMWAVLYLQQYPEYYNRAKKEQEDIIKRRSIGENGLTLMEIKQMEYLPKVINETLRVANLSFAFFREARTEVNINGYTIPKGWKVLPWIRSVHMDPQYHQNPKEFNPSRWDSVIKSGTYMPFGAGCRLCPGMDFAKFEISIFLHYFLVHYKLERVNPTCKIVYLPTTRPADNCIGKVKLL